MAGRLGRRAGVALGAATCVAVTLAPATAWADTVDPTDSAASTMAPSASAQPAGEQATVLTNSRVRRVLGSAADDVSFSVRDRRTGRTFTYNPRLRNATGSIVKVLILTTLVRERRDDGGLTSGQKALADRMIRYSDNDATSSLFRQVGGRQVVGRMARDLGMTSTKVNGAWGLTSTSAADQRLLVDRLVDGTPRLTKSERAYILGLMHRVTKDQRWGVGNVPASYVALKNGWVPISPRGWRVNSIGSVKGSGRDYTLAILSYDNSSMDVGVSRTRKVSGLVWKALAPGAADAATPADGDGATASAGAGSDGTPAAAAAQAGPGTTRSERPFWIRRGAALPPHPFH